MSEVPDGVSNIGDADSDDLRADAEPEIAAIQELTRFIRENELRQREALAEYEDTGTEKTTGTREASHDDGYDGPAYQKAETSKEIPPSRSSSPESQKRAADLLSGKITGITAGVKVSPPPPMSLEEVARLARLERMREILEASAAKNNSSSAMYPSGRRRGTP